MATAAILAGAHRRRRRSRRRRHLGGTSQQRKLGACARKCKGNRKSAFRACMKRCL